MQALFLLFCSPLQLIPIAISILPADEMDTPSTAFAAYLNSILHKAKRLRMPDGAEHRNIGR